MHRNIVIVGVVLLATGFISGVMQMHGVAASPSKGVGPITHVELGPVDTALAARGQEIFEQKCAACHKFEERYVGPALDGVTARRAPEWIMNMVLNPQGMIERDPVARDLLAEHMVPMTFQNVTEADARALLEYLRSMDEARAGSATKNEKPRHDGKR